jgi:intein-encoded DNA endonuclease-like protein
MPKKISLEKELQIVKDANSLILKTDLAKKHNVTTKVITRLQQQYDFKLKKPENKRPSKTFENKILKEYKKGHNTNYISKKYNISQLMVNRILKRNGINFIPKNQLDLPKNVVKEVCKLYLKGFSTCDIALMFNNFKCDRTVTKILRQNDIEIRKSGYTAIFENENLFNKIDTEEKAYLLGFIYADGNVKKTKTTYCFQMELIVSDKYILEEIIKLFGYKKTIKDLNKKTISHELKKPYEIERKKNGKTFKTSSIQIHSKLNYDNLNKLGVKERKTFDLIFPDFSTVPKKFMRHFIRGYFDGDGSFTTSGCAKYVFYGNPIFIRGLHKYLVTEIGVNNNKVFDKKNVSFITYGRKEDVKNIFKYFYTDSNLHLIRKFNKAKPYANIELTK